MAPSYIFLLVVLCGFPSNSDASSFTAVHFDTISLPNLQPLFFFIFFYFIMLCENYTQQIAPPSYLFQIVCFGYSSESRALLTLLGIGGVPFGTDNTYNLVMLNASNIFSSHIVLP